MKRFDVMKSVEHDYLLQSLIKQNEVLEKISQGEDLIHVLETIILSIEDIFSDVMCSVLFWDDKQKILKNAIGPSLPQEYLASLNNGVKIGPNEGSCGTAAFFGETVIVTDISLDRLWSKYRDLPLSFGLRSCWSKPIHSPERKLLGTFAFYYSKPHQPSMSEIDVFERFTYLAGIAMERQKVEQKREKYELMAENITELLLILDPKGYITYASPSFKTTLGYDPDELLGKYSFDYLPLNNVKFLSEEFGKIVKEKADDFKIINIMNRDGKYVPIEVTGVPVLEKSGEVKNIVMVGRDIQERKIIEKALKESEERYRLLVDSSPDAILVHDNGEIVYTNKSGATLIGIDKPSTIFGNSIYSYIDPKDHPIIINRLKQYYCGEAEMLDPVEVKVIKCNGESVNIEITSRVVIYEGRTCVQSIARNITDRKKNEEKIKFLAYHDHLTKLPNRFYFNELIQKQLDNMKQVKHKMAILCFDLDNFKQLNESLGHSMADNVLKTVSEKIRKCIPIDAVIARVSGDEFSILLPNIENIEQVEFISKTILATCNDEVSIEGRSIKTPVSIGVSVYPSHGKDREELVRKANLALDTAKQKGKNNFQLYTEEIKNKFVRKRKLAEDLKYAIENHQFFICYQPIINTMKNKVCSVEALLRWKHPFEGMISPGEFIPISEDNGTIVPIGEWVLRSACFQVKQWQQRGFYDLVLKVNLSVRQFEQENFVEMIANVLKDTSYNPQLLELEITESILMQNTEQTIEILNKLKKLGVKISLDDFGKGFSSLSYLTDFSFDVLKIDRSFIQKVLIDEKSAAIVNTVINLAHQLNLRVVAEGVETEEQFKFLVNNQCEEVQGFFFSHPLPVEDFERLYCT